MQSYNLESSLDSSSGESSEHFFLPLSATGFSHVGPEKTVASLRSKRLFPSQTDTPLLENRAKDSHAGIKNRDIPEILNDLESCTDYDHVNGFLSAAGSNGTMSDGQRSFYDSEEPHDQVFSPPLLLDTSLLPDSYEDLLGMLLSIKYSCCLHLYVQLLSVYYVIVE